MAQKKTNKTSAVKPAAAPKRAAAKKATVKAEAKQPAKKAACATKKCASAGTLTRVFVKFDAGWGNQLYIRGNGGGLSWDKGVLMQCVNDDEWLWEKKISDPQVSFKILLNDSVWACGEDLVVPVGETAWLTPSF